MWGVPTNLLEIIGGLGILISVGITLYTTKQRKDILQKIYHFPKLLWILIILSCMGVVVSQDIRSSLGVLKAYIFFPCLVMISIQISSQAQQLYRYLLKGIIWSGCIIALIAIGQVIASGFDMTMRPTALYAFGLDPAVTQGGFANYIGLYLVPILILSFSSSIFTSRYRYIFSIGILIGIIITQSYGAILAIIGVIFIYILNQYKSKSAISSYWLIGGIIGLMLLGIWQISTPKFQSLLDMRQRNSITTRIQIWDTAITMIGRNPVLGIGLSDFQDVYTETVPEKYFPPYEWLVPEPHNLYFAFWLHLGVGGIIWLGYLMYNTWQVFRQSQNNQLVYWISLSLISLFIYGLVDTPFWKNDLALIMIVLVYGVSVYEKRVS
jgi:O-antigen ligase